MFTKAVSRAVEIGGANAMMKFQTVCMCVCACGFGFGNDARWWMAYVL